MKYIVSLGGRRVEVELGPEGVRVEGVTFPVQLVEVDGTPVRLVIIGSEVHRVVLRERRARGDYVLWLDGHTFAIEALDERTRAIRDLSAAAAPPTGPTPLAAPMPGLIVRVNVAPGDDVRAGQGLVVMEAMKMENELRAAGSGTVKAVHVQAGQAVEKGAVLVEMR